MSNVRRAAILAALLSSTSAPAFAQQATATAAASAAIPSDGTRAPAPRQAITPATNHIASAALAAGPVTFPPAVNPAPKRDKLPRMPRPDAAGYVRFHFGATQPTVVCAPSRLCVVSLEPGEIITGGRDKDIGKFVLSDSVNWTVTPTFSGGGKTLVTQVAIRPSYPGLQASLVIPTNRRLYSITLRSTDSAWMPLVAFTYPGDQAAAYAKAAAAAVAPAASDLTSLSFDYELEGTAPWLPTSVYTDGARTIIVFPETVTVESMPVLVGLGDDGNWFTDATRTVVNSSVLPGNRMLVDGVLTRAALVSGVGDSQTEVLLTRRGS